MLQLAATETSGLRSDAWSPTATPCVMHYSIIADAAPDLLCRVLNLFAMQYLTPLALHVQRQDEEMSIELAVDDVSQHRAQVIGEKMRNLIDIRSVTLEPQAPNRVLNAPVSLAVG